jgi:hypothetical protein
MPNGQRASSIRIGHTTRITYPYQEQEETWIGNTAEAEILIAEGGDQDCVRIELANGAFIECTATALLPTELNGYVAAADLMGNRLAVATRAQLWQATVRFAWNSVTRVIAMGSLPIMYTYVNERDFWISGNGTQFVLMHG